MALILLTLIATTAWAQSFTAPDPSMQPALQSGQAYALATVPDPLDLGRIVVFTRNGQQIARRIVGVPDSKQLAQDVDFALRGQAQWSFWSDVVCWVSGNQPPMVGIKDNIPAGRILLEVAYANYEAAPALGDSLYFVHALNRPAIAEGATRTAAQGADSREWGTVHARDFIGVIQPE